MAAVSRCLETEGQADCEVSVTVVDDEQIAELNRQYRGVEGPTDVLSFSLREGPPVAGDPEALGDVVISAERAQEQAAEYGHSLARELCFLAVHGTLHLLGYDHATREEEERMMARTEAVLQPLGLSR